MKMHAVTQWSVVVGRLTVNVCCLVSLCFTQFFLNLYVCEEDLFSSSETGVEGRVGD